MAEPTINIGTVRLSQAEYDLLKDYQTAKGISQNSAIREAIKELALFRGSCKINEVEGENDERKNIKGGRQ